MTGPRTRIPATSTPAGLNRTLLLARRKAGNEAMDRLFVAYGNAIFGTKELLTWGQRENTSLRADLEDANYRALQAKCLETAGLPKNLYEEAMADQSTHDEWMARTPRPSSDWAPSARRRSR